MIQVFTQIRRSLMAGMCMLTVATASMAADFPLLDAGIPIKWTGNVQMLLAKIAAATQSEFVALGDVSGLEVTINQGSDKTVLDALKSIQTALAGRANVAIQNSGVPRIVLASKEQSSKIVPLFSAGPNTKPIVSAGKPAAATVSSAPDTTIQASVTIAPQPRAAAPAPVLAEAPRQAKVMRIN
jgi:hypothetical protein